MEASIVLNGEIKNGAWLKRNLKGVVLAADGGANICKKFGISPKYVVGDFDSVSKSALSVFKKTSHIHYDATQSSTDFEKSLRIAEKLNAKTIYVFGGFGRELDHEIANILSLTAACIMKDERQTVRVATKRLTISGTPGALVSVIALSDVHGLSYAGLQWPAPKGKLAAGWIGVRNRFSKRNARISLTKGKIAIITHAP